MDLRNPIPLSYKRNTEKGNGYIKSYQAKQTKSECVYCEKPDYRSSDCKNAKTVTERRKIFSYKNFVSTMQELNTGPQNAVALKLA